MFDATRLLRSIILVLLALAVSAQAATYDLTTIPNPSPDSFRFMLATGMADDGTVVGSFWETRLRGFMWDGETLTPINYPDSNWTRVEGISPDGNRIVGSYNDATGTHGFFLQESTLTTVDRAGFSMTEGHGITNAGVIAGHNWAASAYRRSSGGTFTAIAASGARSTQAFGINAADEVVGQYADSNWVHRAYRWTSGSPTVFTLPNTVYTLPRGINGNGVIVGGAIAEIEGGQRRARGFVRQANGNVTLTDPPGSQWTVINAINSAGVIAGYFIAPGGGYHAFVGTPQ